MEQTKQYKFLRTKKDINNTAKKDKNIIKLKDNHLILERNIVIKKVFLD